MDSNSQPPFEETYRTLFGELIMKKDIDQVLDSNYCPQSVIDDHDQLPIIDLSRLNMTSSSSGDDDDDRKECAREIGEAAREWGFFQVVNHGVPPHVLEKVGREQEQLFREPFRNKANYLSTSSSSSSSSSSINYRWGTPTARSISQFSWSEAFHIPLSHVSGFSLLNTRSYSSAVAEFAVIISKLAQTIAGILAENLSKKSDFFVENCCPASCFLRLNRYPPCPYFSQVHGLVPHTDSNFLTILYQTSLGGLQLAKDGAWISVKPNPDALIINIGDLFQAWSNGVYKSIKHRVLTNGEKERLSVAYFMCPSTDTVIQSCCSTHHDHESPNSNSLYRKFTFGEYRERVHEDVMSTGSKKGLLRFLAS